MNKLSFCTTGMIALCGLLLSIIPAIANIPGGGTGTGPDVTVTDNGDGTVTMANGTVSIHIVKNGASINQINYTYNNRGAPRRSNCWRAARMAASFIGNSAAGAAIRGFIPW